MFTEKYFKLLNTKFLGRNYTFIEETSSTNNVASKAAQEGASQGTLFAAKKQSGGKGRFDRHWISPEGGLWFSFILKTRANNPNPLVVIAGASISAAVEEFTGVPCGFHWPNDLFTGGKKFGGILMESRFSGEFPEFIVIGVGINVNIRVEDLGNDLLTPATTLMEELGQSVDMSGLLAVILNRLEEDYLEFIERGPEPVIQRYRQRCITIGKRVKVTDEQFGYDEYGTVADLLDDGGLLIRFDSGAISQVYNAGRLVLV